MRFLYAASVSNTTLLTLFDGGPGQTESSLPTLIVSGFC